MIDGAAGAEGLSLLKNVLALEIGSRGKIGRRIFNRMDIGAAGVIWAPESILDGIAFVRPDCKAE
jgi:hypothetical protein